MTNRQTKLGVTEYGYAEGIIDGNFLANFDAFKAKAATIKKGQYNGAYIMRLWFPEYAESDAFIYMKLRQAQPFFHGLSAVCSDHFHYTDTHGLDLLTVK
jgi:hypothetical protein